jgi:predicted transcriptional regulator
MIDNNIVYLIQRTFVHVRFLQLISLTNNFLMKPPSKAKRSSLDIDASILGLLVATEATLNGITISVKLNRHAAREHLKALVNQGFVRQKQLRFVTYSVTEEGISWLRLYRSLARRMGKEADTDRPDFENINRRKIWAS